MKSRIHRICALPLIAAASLFGGTRLLAQTISMTELQEFSPSGASSFARFGREVALSNDTLMIGAPRQLNFNGGSENGAVYVYSGGSGSWVQSQVLEDPSGTVGSHFGSSLAIDGDRALIGAANGLAVHVYERTGSTWTFVESIAPTGPNALANFGYEVVLDGDFALISGRDFFGYAPFQANAVHAYSRVGGSWQFDQMLTSSGVPVVNASPGQIPFGEHMAIEGDQALISTPDTIEIYARSGITWSLVQTVIPNPDSPSPPGLGLGQITDVALSHDTFAVGHSVYGPPNIEGVLHVYRRSGNFWAKEQELQPSGQNISAIYGIAVDIENDLIAYGSTGFFFANNPQGGEVTVFQRKVSGWVESVVLKDEASLLNTRFGAAVALFDRRVVVGAPNQGPLLGGAYSFDLNERPESFCEGTGIASLGCGTCPCGNTPVLGSTGGCLNSAGSSATLQISGTPQVSDDTVRFGLDGATPSTFAILLSGAQKAPTSPLNPCFGTGSGITSSPLSGLRCVVQDLRRQGTRATDAQGSVGITNSGWGGSDGPSGGLLAQAGLVAGQTRHFQVFYRETPTAGCLRDQNTSQGISIVVRP